MFADTSPEAQRRRARLAHPFATEERFWSKVDKSGEHWLWTGGTSGGGYGTFRMGGRMIGAHVASFLLSGRSLTPGEQVLHQCDIKLCVKPSCLFAGTQADNVADMIAKGRQATGSRLCPGPQRGELNHGAKLTADIIATIKRLHVGGARQADIMRATGATRSNVWAIVHGKSWAHIGASS